MMDTKYSMPTTSNILDVQVVLGNVVADWNRAGANWDEAALAAVYTEDALMFGGRSIHSVGRKAIHAYFTSYKGVILAGAMEMSETEIRVLGNDCVLVQGMVNFTFTLAGGELTNSRLRATLILKQEPDRWRILDHHFSTIPVTPPIGKD